MNNVTDLHQCKASAVPSVPRTISATQRLAALELARELSEYRSSPMTVMPEYARLLSLRAESFLNELAGDAKGER